MRFMWSRIHAFHVVMRFMPVIWSDVHAFHVIMLFRVHVVPVFMRSHVHAFHVVRRFISSRGHASMF